jgi:long-subunit fatty acid transport protein
VQGVRLAIFICLGAIPARASTPDVFGLGSEESAVCGASAARVHDFSAGHYDPAGLTLVEKPEVSIGVLGFGSTLSLPGGKTQSIADPYAVVVGAAAPVPLLRWLENRIYFGLALSILPTGVVRVIAHNPTTDAFFPLYDNRTQRLVVLPSVAVRLPKGVSIGLGFNYLAGLGGHVSGAEGTTRAIEARVDEAIFSILSVNAGIRWQAKRWLALALVYREQFSVPFSTYSSNLVAGQPINIDVDAQGLFTPHQLLVGGALSLPKRVMLSLDVGWSHWSGWSGPFVTVSSQLPLVGPIDARPPAVNFSDTGWFRLGVEWLALDKPKAQVLLRGGYGFESAALASPPAGTQLQDGHKHRLALGLGGRLPFGPMMFRLDAHAQLDVVGSAGIVWAAGAMLTVGQR